MKKFKYGDKARYVGYVNEVYKNDHTIGHIMTIKSDNSHIANKDSHPRIPRWKAICECGYECAPIEPSLEPIQDLGSWEAIEAMTGWRPGVTRKIRANA